jgi:hypothetical protein
MKYKKLNSLGFSHIIVPMMVVVLVAVAGVYALVASHADACLTTTSGRVSGVVSSALSSPVSSPVCPVDNGKKIDGFTNLAHEAKNGTAVFACKAYINAYGGVYNVKYLFTKPAKLANASYQLTGARKNVQYSNESAKSWYNNTVASLAVNMSALPQVDDKLVANIKVNNTVVSSSTISANTAHGLYTTPNQIVNCKK